METSGENSNHQDTLEPLERNNRKNEGEQYLEGQMKTKAATTGGELEDKQEQTTNRCGTISREGWEKDYYSVLSIQHI